MPSSNNWDQLGRGRRFRPKPFDFSFILNPIPPVASHLANSIDSLSPADETASHSTTQDSPLVNEPVLCRKRSCRNPVRANRKHCGDCLDKMSAKQRAWIRKRRNQGIKDPVTGETVKLCAQCSVPSDKYTCGLCTKRQSVSKMNLYHGRRGKGLCTKCAMELDREGYCCKTCYKKDRINARRRSRKKKKRQDKYHYAEAIEGTKISRK
ncbi:hypothetical protein FVEG_00267 [Fusarium verticillioides 7600]|uniref:Uncharacterized protein n=1 Tax=Gibberella moniliformis (strain M3125 / FGSC 7600) TaxID=334819 RepID=W7LKZ6_GIBM7|nr:hypothetical protein FVEG_00267 [Fusarium verticillioides 7600]EWG36114.1 hypothetical protein FVEG_00267 [Fusarium verticillioides 7600]